MDASASAARSRRAAKRGQKANANSDDAQDAANRSDAAAREADRAFADVAARAVRRLDWHASAPQSVLAAVAADDPARVWKAWRRHLSQARPKPLGKLCGVKRSPLAWSLPAATAEINTAALVELTARNDRGVRKRLAGGAAWNEIVETWLAQWLTEWRDAAPQAAHALESIAWCHALPWLADELSPDVWCGLFEHLVSVAVDAAAISITADPLSHQLYAGELPLTLAYLFPQIKNTRAMAKAARRVLSRGPVDLLNGEGLPTWADLAIARPLLACWTRCAAIGREMQRGRGCWDAKAAGQFRWFVLASLRLARRDGSQMLVDGGSRIAAADHEMFAAALALCRSERAERVAEIVLPKGKSAQSRGSRRNNEKRNKYSEKKLSPASYHCEWSGISVLRPRWQRGGTRVALAFGAQHVQLEVCCGRDVVLSGAWDAEVTLDGRRLEAVGTWEESCWLTNKWVDYVELQLPLAENVVLQRHIVLPRQDGFLFLADSVLGHAWRPPRREDDEKANGQPPADAGKNGDRPSRNGDAAAAAPHAVEYRGTIPLGAGIQFAGEAETREAILSGTRDRALVMPLSLPEWRSDPRVGSLSCADGALDLRQSNRGASLVAPLFFDLKRRRFAGQRTWRQLSVGEDRQVQPPDRAVGYRVHVGDKQWIVYRSLTPRGNRSLLSHNLSTEFLVARFEVGTGVGIFDPLVEIE